MQAVNKGTEPKEWINHRTTPGAEFDAIPELKLALLCDQGFVCAYCGCRIPAQGHMKVEHVIPRTVLSVKERMNYGNLVACCPGAIGPVPSKKGFASLHCDSRKGDRPIHFDIFDAGVERRFSYRVNIKDKCAGAMVADDESLQTEIGGLDLPSIESKDNVLNLNHPLLCQNRIAVIKSIQAVAKKANAVKKLTKAWWESLLEFYRTQSATATYEGEEYAAFQPYRAIAIYYISRKLRQYANA